MFSHASSQPPHLEVEADEANSLQAAAWHRRPHSFLVGLGLAGLMLLGVSAWAAFPSASQLESVQPSHFETAVAFKPGLRSPPGVQLISRSKQPLYMNEPHDLEQADVESDTVLGFAAGGSMQSRREVLSVAAAVASTAGLAPLPASASESFEDFLAKKEEAKAQKSGAGTTAGANVEIPADGIFGTPIYLILRVMEATEQQERLVKSGKYKDLQRANIKMAVRMMLTNYNLEKSVKELSMTLPKDKRADAQARGRSANEALVTLKDYFDTDNNSLNVDTISAEKKAFIIKALQSCRQELDGLLQYAPSDAVSDARAFIAKENADNAQELDAAGIKVTNPDPTPTPVTNPDPTPTPSQ